MKRPFCVLITMLVFVAAVSFGAPRTLYVRCGTLVTEADKAPVRQAAVVVADGQITQVGANLPVPPGAEQLDLSAYTVIPALVDAHSHLWTGPFGQTPSDPLAVLRARKAVTYALESGVAALRVVGSTGFIDVALRDAIEEGTLAGPHIVPAGHALSTLGGHGDFFTMPPSMPLADYYTPLNGFVDSPADAERAVHLQIKYGARVIKIAASGGVASPLDSPTAEQLSPEEMNVIVEQAHMANIKVAAHAENLKTILDALHAGVDSIEHGSDLNDEAVGYMKSHGVFLVPTLHVVDNAATIGEQMHLPEYFVRKAKELAAKHFPSFKLALRSGVTLAAGNDGFYQPGKDTVIDELITDVKYGMTPQQALVSATRNGAVLLGLQNLGSIAQGMEGDLVAVEGNPLVDIQALRRARVVVNRGTVVFDASKAKTSHDQGPGM